MKTPHVILKTSHVMLALATLHLSLFCTSCDDEAAQSCMPVYEGFRFTPAVARAGDTLTVRAAQQQKGRLLYHADYRWNVTYLTQTPDGKADTIHYDPPTRSVVYDVESGDPELRWLVPQGAGGVVRVHFRADFRYSAQGTAASQPAGWGQGGAAGGYILPRASSSTDGYCEGQSREIRVLPSL